MITREILEPLEKEDIINLFVEFANKVEKQIQQMQDDIHSLKEENRQLKLPKNSQNSSRPPSHDFGSLPRQKSLQKENGWTEGAHRKYIKSGIHARRDYRSQTFRFMSHMWKRTYS